MTIHPLFTVHTLRPLYMYVFCNVLDFIEAEWYILSERSVLYQK